MNKIKVIKNICGLFSLIIAIIAGGEFFNKYSSDFLTFWFSILENAIGCFILKPTISLPDVYELIIKENSFSKILLYWMYEMAIFIAPFFTASSFIQIVTSLKIKIKNFIFDIICDIKKNNILIWGYNENVELLIDNEKENGRRFIIITDKAFTEDELLSFINRNARVINFNILKATSTKNLKRIKIKLFSNAELFIFLDNNDIENLKNYFEIKEFINENCKFHKNIPMFCHIQDYHIKILSNEINDKEKETKNSICKFDIFDIYQLRMRKFLENNNVIENVNNVNSHHVIIGFGNLGRAIFNDLITQSVVNSFGTITIDILCDNMQNDIHYFLYRINLDYFKEIKLKEKKSECKKIGINENEYFHFKLTKNITKKAKGTGIDGELNVRFFNVNVFNKDFYNNIKHINDNEIETIDNYFVCTSDENTSLRALETIDSIMVKEKNKNDKTRVFVSDEKSKKLESIISKKCYLFPSLKETLNIKTIFNKEKVDFIIRYAYTFSVIQRMIKNKWIINVNDVSNSRKLNRLHKKLKDKFSCLTDREIYDLNDFNGKELTWSTMMHTFYVKKRLICDKFIYEKIYYKIKKILDKGLTSTSSIKKIVLKSENADILEMMKIEHRKWCYNLVFEGLKQGKRGRTYKEELAMFSYDNVLSALPYDLINDLLSLIILLYDKGITSNKRSF